MKKINCILLVEDNHHINYLHKRIINKLELTNHIRIARTGDEAIDYLEKCSQEPSGEFPMPDLIFMDINMPRMTGWELLEELKKERYNAIRERAVIALLTASINPDDKSKAEAMPEVVEFLTKPLSIQILAEIVERYFNK